MNIEPTAIPDVLVLEPKIFVDSRGSFFESFNAHWFEESGIRANFVQDNHSRSAKNVLRGLHYQIAQPQGKLVRAVRGEVFDVAVDIRRSSPTFGKWVSAILSEQNKKMLWIPPGFAHGFLALSEGVDFLYKTTEFYSPADERTILWNDSDLGIQWPVTDQPVLSAKDLQGKRFRDAECFE